jgi:hypothetical protein
MSRPDFATLSKAFKSPHFPTPGAATCTGIFSHLKLVPPHGFALFFYWELRANWHVIQSGARLAPKR